MAVTYRAGATANDGQTSTGSSAAVVIPATAQIGDVALFCMVQNSGSSLFTAPAGWTLKRGPDTINSNLRTAIWVKQLVSGEPGSTVTFTSNVGARLPGAMVVFAGTSAALASAVEISTKTTAGTSVTSPPIATAVDYSGIVGFWVLRDNTASPSATLTVPATHTAGAVSKTAFGSAPNYTVASSYRTTPGVAGTYGTTTGTASESVTAVVYYLALAPSTVAVTPPVASFTASPTSGDAPLAVTFTDTSTNTPTSWSWNFGDGDTSTSQNPTHTYDSAGVYTVSMTATNAGGFDAATTATITAAATEPGGGMQLYSLQGGSYVALTSHILTTD